jgi:hypothetical protein
MSDDVSDGNDGDEPWFLQEMSGRASAAAPHWDDMNEVVKTLEPKPKTPVTTMADGVGNDGNGDEPLVPSTLAGRTDAQSLTALWLDEMLVCYRKRAEAHQNEMQDLNTKLRSQFMMLQSMMSATIPKVNASANSHSNESEPTKSESCSSNTQVTQTTNHKHNTRSRKDNECKKVTFENTTFMFPKVNVPDNSHSNESTSINSASHSPHTQVAPTTYHEHNTGSRKANECKNTTFENTTPNAELLTLPTGNLTSPPLSPLMTQPPENLADHETDKENHKPAWTGTTRPPPKKCRNPSKSTPTVQRALAPADADQHLRDTNCAIPSFLAHARPDPLTTNAPVNELRPLSRLRPQSCDHGSTRPKTISFLHLRW